MKAPASIFELGFDRNQEPVERINLPANNGIPSWLNGSFIRNGPGMFYIGENRLNHWFDGLGMLHKFDFKNGEVWYQSKFIECNASEQALNGDRLTYSEFATDPCWSLFGRLRSMFNHGPTDSAKVNLAKIGERFYALGETTMQIELDPESLESIGKFNFNQPKFGTSSTAHPHVDEQGAYNMITQYGPINRYRIMSMDDESKSLASVISFDPSYMHSFGMSNKYFVIAESPYTVQSINLIAINRPFIENFKWKKNRGTRIWVIDKVSGKTILKKEIEPFFFFSFRKHI